MKYIHNGIEFSKNSKVMNLSKELTESLRSYPIHDLLTRRGYRRISGCGKNQFYENPIRPENCPSFCVNPIKNRWKDYGSTDWKGRSVFDLVMQIDNCDFQKAINTVSEMKNGITIDSIRECNQVLKDAKKEYLLSFVSEANDFPYSYIKYFESRKISVYIAKLAGCKYFTYSINEYHKKGIGFKNNLNGWAIRHIEKNAKKSKVNVGAAYYTYVKKNEYQSNGILIFEGFFNYLTYLQTRFSDAVKRKGCKYYEIELKDLLECDVLILNANVTIGFAFDVLAKYTHVLWYGDNDEAGVKCLNRLLYFPNEKDSKYLKDLRFRDLKIIYKNYEYVGYSDNNDYLCGVKPNKCYSLKLY